MELRDQRSGPTSRRRAGSVALPDALRHRIPSAGPLFRYRLPALVCLLTICMMGCRDGETSDSDSPSAKGAQMATLDAPNSIVTTGEATSPDGVRIQYEVRGSGDPALVLVHGWTNSRGIWGRHPSTLSRHHRVVALDLAGHGASGSNRAEWTMDAFGGDVAAVVEQLDLDPVVLVGYSMGGPVVLEAAEQLEERVIGVILVDTIHDPEMSIADSTMEQMLARFRAAWGDTAFVRSFAFRPDTPDSLVEHVTGMMPPTPREHWFPAARAMARWTRTDLKPALQRLDVPIAAINTTNRPTNLVALQSYAPSYAVDTIDGVGHAGILLRRVADFDALLLARVERFVAAAPDTAAE